MRYSKCWVMCLFAAKGLLAYNKGVERFDNQWSLTMKEVKLYVIYYIKFIIVPKLSRVGFIQLYQYTRINNYYIYAMIVYLWVETNNTSHGYYNVLINDLCPLLNFFLNWGFRDKPQPVIHSLLSFPFFSSSQTNEHQSHGNSCITHTFFSSTFILGYT